MTLLALATLGACNTVLLVHYRSPKCLRYFVNMQTSRQNFPYRHYGSGRYRKDLRMNIYVGGSSHEATEEDLRQVFEAFGQGASVRIITDKFSGA